jgi:hypothetical protein
METAGVTVQEDHSISCAVKVYLCAPRDPGHGSLFQIPMSNLRRPWLVLRCSRLLAS